MIYARIAGTGSYLPGEPVSNDDLVKRGIETSDEWIVSRSGIRSRHLAAADTGASDLARVAAERAIEAAGTGIFPSDADALETDAGRTIGFVRLLARRTGAPSENFYDPTLGVRAGAER